MYSFYLNTYNLTYSVQLENSSPPKTGTGYWSNLHSEEKKGTKQKEIHKGKNKQLSHLL